MNNIILNLFIFLVCSVFVIIYFRVLSQSLHYKVCKIEHDNEGDQLNSTYDYSNFENFNNILGMEDGRYIVPNYVHFVRFGSKELSFIEAVCIMAAFINQGPEKIYIHTDVEPEGKYWKKILSNNKLKNILKFRKVEMPTEIFGRELNAGWVKWHASDVIRIKVLMKYGGVYLDNDSYIVRSINDFRRFEISLGWMMDSDLANQVIVANKNARFLRLWLDSFKDYDPSEWYGNAGTRPTKQILQKKPYLIHREKYLLANHHITTKLYLENWEEWRSHYAIHLLYNHQYILQKNLSSDATYPVSFNENNIALYNATIREMVYDVFPVSNT